MITANVMQRIKDELVLSFHHDLPKGRLIPVGLENLDDLVGDVITIDWCDGVLMCNRWGTPIPHKFLSMPVSVLDDLYAIRAFASL